MKKHFTFTNAQLIVLIISIIVSTIIAIGIFYLIFINLGNTNDKIIATVGALGNISGGVIGGIVAYIVAKTQVSSSESRQEQQVLQKTISHLKLMNAEFNYNKKLITEFKDDFVSGKSLFVAKQLSINAWQNNSAEVSEKLSNDNLETLLNTVTATNLLKLHIESNEKIGQEHITLDEIEELCTMLEETTTMLNKNIQRLTSLKQ